MHAIEFIDVPFSSLSSINTSDLPFENILETGQIEFDKLDPPLGSVMNDAVSVLEQGERFRFRPENRIEAGSSCELELSE